MAEKTRLKVLINNVETVIHPETETAQIEDMTVFMKTLSKQGIDSATVRSLIGSSSPTLDIGTVSTGAAGSDAAASITDHGDNNYSLNLTIPRGDTGDDGDSPIISPSVNTSTLAAGSSATASWSGAGTSTNPLLLSLGIPRGSNGTNGTNGTTPTFSSTCTVSTLSAGSSATASVSGSGTSSSPYKFSFGIPKGATGSTGPTGPTGPSAISAATLSTNGYIKLSNGLIIQWGMHTATSGTNLTTITYPIKFPSSVYIVGPMPYQNASLCMVYGSVTTTSCQISSFKFANSVISGSNISFVWIAIGK